MSYQIVEATESTMNEVEAWLREEEERYQADLRSYEKNDYEGDIRVRGFLCNWNSVKRGWSKGVSSVHILLLDGKAIGFLDGTDILEIKPDMRGQGYGKVLAKLMIQNAREQGKSVLEIDIAPPSAEPFWKRMGFTPVSDRSGPGGGIYAYKILHRMFTLGGGNRVPYSIEFFTPKERFSSQKTLSHFSGVGEILPSGSVQLPSRAYCFDPEQSGHSDYFVRIIVDGELLYFDKTKYESSKFYGVDRDPGYIYYLDRIDSIEYEFIG